MAMMLRAAFERRVPENTIVPLRLVPLAALSRPRWACAYLWGLFDAYTALPGDHFRAFAFDRDGYVVRIPRPGWADLAGDGWRARVQLWPHWQRV